MNRTRHSIGIALIVVLAVVATACGTTETAAESDPGETKPSWSEPSERSDLGSALDELIAGTRLPAVGATTFTAESTIESDVAGVRKDGDPTPAEVTDRFSIGSNAKAMTATMVATFVDDGVIDWDTTIADVYGDSIPLVDPTWAALTLRQLLSHTAGLDDEALIPTLETIDDAAPVTAQRREVLVRLAAAPLQRPPGEFAYSNIGYTLVGAMLEEVTNSSWEDLIQARIFDALEMASCGFYAPGTPGQIDQPWGHNEELGGQAMDPGAGEADLPEVLAPAGMVHCSMADWVRFLQSQLRGFQGSTTEIVSPEAFQAIQTPAVGSDYAFGWVAVPDPDGSVIFYHHGSNRRFTTEVWLDPTDDWGLITVTNIGETIADPLLATINEAMFNRRTTS